MTNYCVECKHCEVAVYISPEEKEERGSMIDFECAEYGTHVNFYDNAKDCFENTNVPLLSTIGKEGDK